MNYKEFGERAGNALPAIIGFLIVSFPDVAARFGQLYPFFYWGTLMISVSIIAYAVYGLFESSGVITENQSDGKVYIGEGFEKGTTGSGTARSLKPDQNGKVYFRFRLIQEGACKGMYESVPDFHATRSDHRDDVKELEMRDIIESGFDIFTTDPKGSN